MRELNGRKRSLQKLDAAPQIKRKGITVGINCLSVDHLERQVGLATRAHPCVVKARDVRMSERGQNVALARKSLRKAVG